VGNEWNDNVVLVVFAICELDAAVARAADVVIDDVDDDDDDDAEVAAVVADDMEDVCDSEYSTSQTRSENALRTFSRPAASWLGRCGFQLTTLHGRQCYRASQYLVRCNNETTRYTTHSLTHSSISSSYLW
jgi:hypothetical protein